MKKLLISLTMCLLCSVVSAQTIKDLYTAQVLSENSDNEQSLKKALTQVLIKLTGDYKLPNKFAIQSQLKQLNQFVLNSEQQHRKTDKQSVLTVHFDPAKVDNLLQKFNLIRWHDERPNWLVWIVLDDGTKPVIINSEDTPDEANLVLNQANERGLPLLLPLLDLEERAHLPMDDFIQANRTVITELSKRYAPDIILLAHVTQQADTWQAEWNLYTEKPVKPWMNTQSELPTLLTAGINKAVDIISSQLIQLAVKEPIPQLQIPVIQTPIAVEPPTPPQLPVVKPIVLPPIAVKSVETVATTAIPIDTTSVLPPVTQPIDIPLAKDEFELTVVNVPNLETYTMIYSYLRELDAVDNIFVQRIQPDQVSFRITAKGGISALEQTLNDSGLLTSQSIFSDEIVYRLR